MPIYWLRHAMIGGMPPPCIKKDITSPATKIFVNQEARMGLRGSACVLAMISPSHQGRRKQQEKCLPNIYAEIVLMKMCKESTDIACYLNYKFTTKSAWILPCICAGPIVGYIHSPPRMNGMKYSVRVRHACTIWMIVEKEKSRNAVIARSMEG
jgi:hypothetical protein